MLRARVSKTVNRSARVTCPRQTMRGGAWADRSQIMNNFIRYAAAAGSLLLCARPACALTIVRTSDASLAANLSPADVISANAAFDYAAAQLSALFNDPVQIN